MVNIPNPSRDEDTDSSALKQRTFSYPYAITAHKSQGSEYQNIIVDDSDVRRYGGNTDNVSYRRVMYTTITRAKHKAIVVTNGARFDGVNRFFLDKK